MIQFFDIKGNLIAEYGDEPEWMKKMNGVEKAMAMSRDPEKTLELIKKLASYGDKKHG